MDKYEIRLCGNEWRYCNGICAQCPLMKIEYSTTTTYLPKRGDRR